MNFKPTKAVLLSALLSIGLSHTALSRVAGAKLTDIIKRSDFIVIGTVSEVTEINGYRVAKLQVEVALKGETQTRELFFLASPTWACDVSNAKTGEHGLYFLSLPAKSAQLPALQNNQPITLIQHFGYGRLLSGGQGKYRISSMIYLPEGFPVEELRPSSNERLTLISVKDIAKLIG